MKVLGLIVEYNPLHNGHLHHINESKKLVNPDVTIAVMSGHFTQRGEPACTTKWNRAQTALEFGVDLVIELPYAYSNQSADFFAIGAISILNHIGATHLVFGSESGSIQELTNLANTMDDSKTIEKLKEKLKTGLNLPNAYAEINPSLTGSNNTLGIQYIRAINQLKADISPLTISRFASNYNDQTPNHKNITSATSIRKMIDENIDYSDYVPKIVLDPHVTLQTWDNHYKYLRHKLLTARPYELEKIHDMVEGIENRLIKAAKNSNDFNDFINEVKTKRYTQTRIQRICANVLTGLTKEDIKDWNLLKGTQYIRVIGFNKTGSLYLKLIKENIEIPIYSTFSNNSHPMLKQELQVTSAFASVYDSNYMSEIISQEYCAKPVIASR